MGTHGNARHARLVRCASHKNLGYGHNLHANSSVEAELELDELVVGVDGEFARVERLDAVDQALCGEARRERGCEDDDQTEPAGLA